MTRAAQILTGDRKCTDVLFLLAFIIFWIGCIVISGIAYDGGDPRLLYYPKDSYGSTCGLGNTTGLPRLTMPGANLVPIDDTQICVKDCPATGDISNPQSCLPSDGSTAIDHSLLVCSYAVQESDNVTRSMVVSWPNYVPNADGKFCYCAYQSISLMRRCFPEETSTFVNASEAIQNSITSRAEMEQAFTDISNSASIIFGLSVLTVVVCFVWSHLMAYMTKPIVWLTIIAFLALMVAIAAYMWSWVATLDSDQDTVNDEVDSSRNVNRTVRVFTYLWTVVCVLAIVMVIALRKRIVLACEIIEEAGLAMKDMPRVLFFPVVAFIVMILYLLYWFSVAVYLASFTNEKKEKLGYTDSDVHTMRLYWFFAFFWNTQFLLAFDTAVLGGAFAAWYWTREKQSLPSNVVFQTAGKFVRYHIGSVAFGALIVAVVEMIRSVVTWIQAQLEASGQSNQVVRCLFCVFQCCFACVERFLLFINRNAYIMIAVHGDNFLVATGRAFTLILNNALRVATVSIVSDYVLWLSKLSVTLLVCLIGTSLIAAKQNVSYWLFPVLVLGFFSYVIATGFFLVYEVAIDVILICFLDETEMRKKDSSEPPYMSDDLVKFIKTNATAASKTDKKPLLE